MELLIKTCGLLARLLGVYSFLIWIRIILTWVRNPALQQSGAYQFLCTVVDPFLGFFRPKNHVGRIDFSPLFALMTINIVRSALEMISLYGKVTIWLILAVVIQNVWSYIFRFLLLILLVMLIVRFFMGRSTDPMIEEKLNAMDRNLNAPVGVVFRLFYSGKNPTDQTLVVASIIFYGVLFFGLKYGVQALTQFLVTL